MRLELVLVLELTLQLLVVVDLAVDREDDLSIGAHERLRAGVYTGVSLFALQVARAVLLTDTDDRKTFVREDGLLAAVAP